MKKMGKIGRLNAVANRMLAKLWIEKDIRWCEYPLPHDCSQGLTNAHRHKRVWYRSRPALLWDFGQVIRICLAGHQLMEHDRELTEAVFANLRGEETAY